MKQVQVAVVGASGYTGQELLRILLNHRGVKLVCATYRQSAGQPLWEVCPRCRQVPGSDLKFTDSDVDAIAATGAEVAVLALPHGVAASYARGLVDRGVRCFIPVSYTHLISLFSKRELRDSSFSVFASIV